MSLHVYTIPTILLTEAGHLTGTMPIRVMSKKQKAFFPA